MANQWLRLWLDLPNDPKFRTIARVSSQSISSVIAVYVHMLCCAANATERGRTEGWCDEDIATALDIEIEKIVSIREAMQGRLLDGDYLTGWEKRQPLKEDGAAARAKAWREAKKEQERTQPNAAERNQTADKNRLDKSKPKENNKKKIEVDFYDVPQNVIDDFKALRKVKKAAITQTAINRIKSQADKAGISLADALTLCCSRNWAGFEADWIKNERKSGVSWWATDAGIISKGDELKMSPRPGERMVDFHARITLAMEAQSKPRPPKMIVSGVRMLKPSHIPELRTLVKNRDPP